MGDQHDRHPVALLEIEQQVEDLGLGRHVQRRRRLVGDQESGIGGQRHRDHRPLSQTTAELVGVLVDPALRPRHSHQPQQLDGAGTSRLRAHRLVQPNRLDDLVTDGVHRAERGHRLLEDEPDLAAVDRPHLRAIGLELHQIDRALSSSPSSCSRLAVLPSRSAFPLQQDLTADDTPRAIDDAHDRARGDTLAAATLADDPERPARKNVEAGAIDRLDQPVILEEVGLQVAHGEERRVGSRKSGVGSGGRRAGKTASRGDVGVAHLSPFLSYHPITLSPYTYTLRVRVGGVAQTVAEEVEGQDDQDDRYGRYEQPG